MKRAMMCVVLALMAGRLWPLLGQDAGDKPFLHAAPEDLQWWRDARFGMFVHWGPVSLKGTEIGWSRGGERRGIGGTGEIPLDVYDTLYKEFNPVEFNAQEWVSIAQAAGMKYLVFTSKHHDGFCMFDSKLTDFKVTNSPFKRDVVAELADACHAAKFPIGFYYSPPDFHHQDFRSPQHDRYIQYMHGQLRELLSNYGGVDIIWFDGLNCTAKEMDSEVLFKMIRELQPHVLLNNRGGLPGDWDTPEQEIGRFQINRPWETCMTICQQWAWKPDDRMKSLKECLHTLIRCAGGDGNLLFNVGPMPTGAIEPRQVERLKEMGLWLKEYGETIYKTRGGPIRPGPWGCTTYQGNQIFVHILDATQEALSLPGISRKILSSACYTGGQVQVHQTEEAIEIALPKESRRDIDAIVALTLDGPASDVVARRQVSLTAGKAATASTFIPGYDPGLALDGNEGTRWATAYGTYSAWLEVDLGAPTTFNRAIIMESCGDRAQSFELQRKEGEEWKAFHRGTKIGQELDVKFEPVTAQRIRLNIIKANEGPTIWEFQLFQTQ